MAEVKLKEETELWEPRGPAEDAHGSGVEPAHLKEEPELCIKQEPQEFPFHMVTVKTEDDEDKSSVLHQRPTEENREETNGWDSGAEAGCSSDPLTQFHSDSEEEEHTDSSEDTDHSEDYSQEQAPAKRSYAMIPPDATVREKRPYSCSECGKIFKKKLNLMQHMSVHSKERPYSCSECGKSFRRKSQLWEHKFSHSEEKRHNCPECGKKFTRKSNVKRHMLSHLEERPHKCSICEKSFTQKDCLRKHLRNKHHMCTVCEVCFSDDTNLKEHLKVHEEDGTLHQSFLKSYSWSDCRPYSCSECGKRFAWEPDVERHMLVHSEDRPHKCSFCEKKFKFKSHLQMHVLVHTGERPFSCSECGKKFPRKRDVKTHMSVHTRERPHSCSFCGKSYKEKSGLARHLRCVHPICPVCQEYFQDKMKLTEHLNSHVEDGAVDQSRKSFLERHMLDSHTFSL